MSAPTEQGLQRWLEYEAELRSNAIRIVAIGAFYLVHLAHFWQISWGAFELAEGPVDRDFHLRVTFVAVIWTMLACGIHLALRHRTFPNWLPFFSTLADVVLLTSLLCFAGGQQSPLVIAYVLIVALSALRLNLPLIRSTTLAALLGYLFLLAIGRWPEFFGAQAVGRVPRYAQLMTLLAIGLAGVTMGQVVRCSRELAGRIRRGADGEEARRD